jgi:hypothetical protein
MIIQQGRSASQARALLVQFLREHLGSRRMSAATPTSAAPASSVDGKVDQVLQSWQSRQRGRR